MKFSTNWSEKRREIQIKTFFIQQPYYVGILAKSRDRLRFFVQVGHEITYASIGNKQFSTKSSDHQTYQNY